MNELNLNLPRFRDSVEQGDLRGPLREGLLALCDIAAAAHRATNDREGEIVGAVEHSQRCARWVELDDVSAELHALGECDCGLAALEAALARFDFVPR